MSKRKASQMTFLGSRSLSSPADLVKFYEGSGTDDRGRSLSQILSWNASKLEASHDYIQTVFPLPETSGVNWDAPVIDRRVFDAFRSRSELREKLRESFQKILWFYGFELKEDASVIKVVKGANYDKHKENWDSRFDHNHLRITRIIRCLRVLGLQDEALAFRSALEENTKYVSPRSREYWRRAAERALNLRPDLETSDEEDDSVGPKFLREFEQEEKKRKAKQTENSASSGEAQSNIENAHSRDEKDVAEKSSPDEEIDQAHSDDEWEGCGEDDVDHAKTDDKMEKEVHAKVSDTTDNVPEAKPQVDAEERSDGEK